jgi:hypothetical protein
MPDAIIVEDVTLTRFAHREPIHFMLIIVGYNDLATLLLFEQESYNPATGTIVYWVQPDFCEHNRRQNKAHLNCPRSAESTCESRN